MDLLVFLSLIEWRFAIFGAMCLILGGLIIRS